MNNSTWYYTLSAVAQTCGALVAIGGAVIVFKLTNIEKELNDFRSRVIKAILSPVTGRSEAELNYFEDDELVEKYKQYKDKIFVKEQGVNVEISAAIIESYGLKGRAEFWVRTNFSTFLSVLNARRFGLRSFWRILILLTAAIVFNIILLIIIHPNDHGANILFYIVAIYSLVSIILSAWLSWNILTIKIFDFKKLSESSKKLFDFRNKKKKDR